MVIALWLRKLRQRSKLPKFPIISLGSGSRSTFAPFVYVLYFYLIEVVITFKNSIEINIGISQPEQYK